MSKHTSREQYVAWADRARAQASEATTEVARAIHLDIARDYDAKAARVTVDDTVDDAPRAWRR